jgi:hypothetical protein
MAAWDECWQNRRRLAAPDVGSALTLNRYQLFQLFKYGVYTLIAFNVYLFFVEEFAAARLQFPEGVPPSHWIEAYAATIDTAAWLILLLLFEAETNWLADDHFTRRVVWSLHGLRLFSYTFIVYAFYGYIVNLQFVSIVDIANGISDLCSIAEGNWSYAVTLDQYEQIGANNCAAFSPAEEFFRYSNMQVLVDQNGFTEIFRLAWVDVINAGVWLLVVLNLEIDVRLQEHGKLDGMILKISNAAKFLIYSILFLAAVYWGFKGDFVDFWDAFLWLVAFVFIEMNVFNWRQEALLEQSMSTAQQPRPA